MPYIRGRITWGAARPKKLPTHDDWSPGVTLVLHHTAGGTPTTLLAEHADLRTMQRMHFANGWSDIGYNYIIAPSGRIYEGRGYGVRGAHTKYHNTNTIGVSLMGNFDKKRPTIRQRIALVWLARRLKRNGARILDVKGHREMPRQATACPGRYGAPLVGVVKVALGVPR